MKLAPDEFCRRADLLILETSERIAPLWLTLRHVIADDSEAGEQWQKNSAEVARAVEEVGTLEWLRFVLRARRRLARELVSVAAQERR